MAKREHDLEWESTQAKEQEWGEILASESECESECELELESELELEWR